MRQRPEVIRQPVGAVIATLALLSAAIIVRTTAAPPHLWTGAGSDMPLGDWIERIFPTGASVCIAGIAVALINATMLTGIIVRYSVSPLRTYVPMTLYAIAAYGFFTPGESIACMLLPLLAIMSANKMIASFRRSYQFGNVFISAVYMGLLPMLYAPSLLLTVIIPVTLVIYRRTLREAAVAAVGLLLPWLLCSVIWWGSGEQWGYVTDRLIAGITVSSPYQPFTEAIASTNTVQLIFFALYALILLCSVAILFTRLGSQRTRPRKIYIHFLWLLLLCFGLLFLTGGDRALVSLLAVPGCVVMTSFFIHYRGWLPWMIYLLLLFGALLANLAPLYL